MQTKLVAALAAGLALAGGSLTAEAQGRLNVYCTVNQEWCQAMTAEFAKKTGIETNFTRKGTGEVYAQIKAEASNPKGDIWWGGTGDPHLQAAEEKLTMQFESPAMKDLQPWAVQQWQLSDKRSVGIYLGVVGFVYNTEVLAKKKLAPPATWADLIKPEYKGEIQMAYPHSSGTAYLVLATMVQLLGENQAFEYFKTLNGSVNQYAKQGPVPGQAVARGETGVAITFLHDGLTSVSRGFPVVPVAPAEGTGYEIGSMSIIDGARNLDNAKKFYEFALSAEGQATAVKGESYSLPSNKTAPLPPRSPDISKIKLINYDFKKYGSAEERKRLLVKWDAEVKATPQ
jgi:iron(III) transport system substrate-binding protein